MLIEASSAVVRYLLKMVIGQGVQPLCADVDFRRRSFANMIMTYLGKEIADLL